MLKIINIHKIVFIVAILVASSSCSKFFELQRPPQNPWTYLSDFDKAAIGSYAGLFSGHQWDMAWVNAAVVKNSMGDDVNWVNDAEWGYWRETKQYNIYTDKNITLLYRTIGTVNNALDFVDKNNGNPYPDEDSASIKNNLNRIVGELHFIRGYAYYYLQTTFGNAYVPGGDNSAKVLPIPTKYATTDVEAKNPPIGSAQEVFDLIIADLKKAKDLLPEKYIEGIHPAAYQVRATKYAASAMLMRTYFQIGDYTSVLLESNFIIDNNKGDFNLTEDPIEAFNKSTIARGKEVIFYAPYYDNSLAAVPNHLTVLNNIRYDSVLTPWCETRMGEGTIKRLGWMNNPLTDTTINLAAKSDKRFTQLFALRYPKDLAKTNQAVDSRTQISNITTVWNNKYFRGPGRGYTNVPLIRLAEIYLTRSICRFRGGDKSGAASDLNVVRKRAWNSSVGGPYIDISSIDITEQTINDERLIELFNESDRIDYLRGLKVPISKGERGPGDDPYTSKSFVWDIPQREINYNEKL